MRPVLAVLLGVIGGIAVAWWVSRDTPAQADRKQDRAEASAAATAEDAQFGLYRWRDDAGRLHVTDTPPKGRRFERISSQPESAIEVHGERN